MKKIFKIIPKKMCMPLILALVCNTIAYFGTRIITTSMYHHNLSNKVDDMIPLVPEFIIIYWGCYIFWGINYIIGVRQNEDEAYKFISADFVAKIICLIIFVVFPTTNTRPDLSGDGICMELMRLLYGVDAADNLFPSIHCLTSWFCFIAVRKNDKIANWYKVASFVITVLICISTLTTKQHVLIDVAAGLILAEGCYQFVKRSGFWKFYRRFFE